MGKTARLPLAPRTELNLRLAANPEGSPSSNLRPVKPMPGQGSAKTKT
jgi:hypothetical protein